MRRLALALSLFALACSASAQFFNPPIGPGSIGQIGPSAGAGGGASCQSVGGVCVGAAGTGIYAGFTLSFGDAFASLDAVGPSNPNGKYFMTRGYGASFGPAVVFRAIAASISNVTDPLTTGYNDANRGVAVGYDNVRIRNGGGLTLQTRAAKAAEILTFPNQTNNLNVTGTLNTDGSLQFFPTATCPIIYESNRAYKNNIAIGYVAADWSISGAPVAYNNANEWDEFETDDGSTAQVNVHPWTARVSGGGLVFNYGSVDQATHTSTAKLSGASGGTAILDGVTKVNDTTDNTNSFSLPQYLIIQSSVNGSLVQATWNASGTTQTSGSWVDINWIRIWRTTGCAHFTPQAAIGTAQPLGDSGIAFSYNGTGAITIPAAATLWGSTPDNEYVQCRPFEPNEPGTSLTTSYQQFPSYVTYNTGTRVLSVDFSANTGNAGVIHCYAMAWNNAGGDVVPARFNIYRAPNITQTTMNGAQGSAFSQDVYFGCDVGIVTPKTMTVSGLPSGLNFTVGSSPTTFTISGTPTGSGTSTLSIGCTNAAGQNTTANVSLVVSGGFLRTWQANRTDTSNTTPVTYNAGGDPSIGAANANRVVAVAAGCRIGGTGITSMTIGGVSATQATGAAVGIASGENADIWYASVPTGTTAAVVVTWQAACARSSISVWSIITTTPAPSAAVHNTITAAASGSSLSLGALTVPAGGGGIAFVFGRDSASACTNPCISSDTWTNASSDYFTNGSAMAGSSASGADVTGTGSVTPSVVFAGANLVTAGSVGEVIGTAAAWGP